VRTTRKVLGLAAIVAVTIVGFLGLAGQQTTAKEPIRKFEMQTVEAAIEKFGIQVEQPKQIPFDVKASLGTVGELPDGVKILQMDYIGEKDWVTVEVIPKNVIWLPSEEYEIVTVNLNGHDAQYMDNDAVQMLLWSDGDLTHLLTVGGTKRTVEEILDIANSFAFDK